MPFIGNTPDVNFTSFAKQDLTGVTGSPTAKREFTLTHAVANANEIEVFVNNVRQEPTEAYTVNGTGLTMTGDVETSDDFYIIYLGKAIQTTVPPDGSVSTAKIASSAVDLTSKVTGVLPVANGGTGLSSASGMVKILDTTITNQPDFVLTSSHINSTYDKYQMFYHFSPATDSTQLYAYAYVGGSRITSTNHSIQIFPLDGGSVTTNTSIDLFFRLNRYNIGSADGEGVSGSAILQNVNSTTVPYCISGQNTEITDGGSGIQNVFGGSAKATQRADVLNGIQFIFSGGNIASGTFELYGVV